MIDRIDNYMKIFNKGDSFFIGSGLCLLKDVFVKEDKTVLYKMDAFDLYALNSDIDFSKTLKAMGMVGITKATMTGKYHTFDKDYKVIGFEGKKIDLGNLVHEVVYKLPEEKEGDRHLIEEEFEENKKTYTEIGDDTYFLGYGKDGLAVLIKDEQYIQALELACEMNREAVVRQETIVDLLKEISRLEAVIKLRDAENIELDKMYDEKAIENEKLEAYKEKLDAENQKLFASIINRDKEISELEDERDSAHDNMSVLSKYVERYEKIIDRLVD